MLVQALVVTTVNEISMLLQYAKNALLHGHHPVIIVIGDLKTPHKRNLSVVKQIREMGLEGYYLDTDDQERWLGSSCPLLKDKIPHNSDNRRNVGYLIAAQMGAGIIISVDDDNLCPETDFFGYHSIVGKNAELNVASSHNNWFNPCIMLSIEPQVLIYPRGFPYSKRFTDASLVVGKGSGRIVINLGLWTGHPDVDAITNLSIRPRSLGLKDDYAKIDHVIVNEKIWLPINTQNTAFAREVLPCCYYVLMGEIIGNMPIDRYGDIWGGYFAKKVLSEASGSISVGRPLTVHARNPHDLILDLKSELWGIVLSEKIVEWLESLDLPSKDYFGAYTEIAERLPSARQLESIKGYLKKISDVMKAWLASCAKIL